MPMADSDSIHAEPGCNLKIKAAISSFYKIIAKVIVIS